MPNTLRFRQWKTPKQNGERARLKVLHGPDTGSIFVVTADHFTIGRGDENDVVFADLRASRKHADVIRLPSGAWKFKDQGSQNGFVHNGLITREATVNAGDFVTVGETAFEFVPEDTGAKLLHTAARALPRQYLVGSPGQAVALAQVTAPAPTQPAREGNDFQGMAGIAGIGAINGTGGDSSEKRKKIYIGLVVILAIWMYLDDSESKKPKAKDPKVAKKEEKEKKEKEAERDLASYLPPVSLGGGAVSSAETFFQEGFREYREKNYLRARVQFETALQINPSYAMARSFLKECDHSIERDVQSHLDRGRRDLDAGKLKSARSHFEAVQRLLSREPESPSFIEAKDQLRAVENKLKKGGSES